MSGARCPGWLWSRAGGPSLAAPPGHSSGLVVETELLHQYFITFCCYVTNGSRWTVWHSDIWHGRVCETKVWNWIPSWRKNCTQWHSLMLLEHLWNSNSECEHSAAVGGVFQQWRQRHWKTSHIMDGHVDFNECGMKTPLVHWWWKCIGNSGDYAEK